MSFPFSRHLCLCEDCIRESLDDPLLVARARLETYKALASDSYICLHSDDPIIYAFKLRRTLKDIASTEIYFVVYIIVTYTQSSVLE